MKIIYSLLLATLGLPRYGRSVRVCLVARSTDSNNDSSQSMLLSDALLNSAVSQYDNYWPVAHISTPARQKTLSINSKPC